MIGLRFNRATAFFDTAAVLARVDEVDRPNMIRGGSFIRQSARRSMRSRKKASAPGTPPSAHKKDKQHPHGPQIKEKTFFGFDSSTDSVVVGPEILPGSRGDVVDTLEKGGTVTRTFTRKSPKRLKSEKAKASFKRLRAAGRIVVKKSERVTRTVRIAERGFMGRAVEREKSKLAGVWKDTV